MNILICSDGTPASDNAARLAGLVARPTRAQTTLLGIAEDTADEPPLRKALDREAEILHDTGVEIVVRSGEPIAQIRAQTRAKKYDLVIVGARHKEVSGPFWRSRRTYEVIKAVEPPVLIAIGDCERLARFLVCSGGKHYIDEAVRLTGTLAAVVGARVTLLHVMAEPPAIYADLVQMEEDVSALLASGSELGRNLTAEKEALEKLGVVTNVRVRHGFVVDQIFDEMREGDYDLIVSGSSHARGPLRHYIMGDLTRSIVNRAGCPVLVARGTKTPGGGNLFGYWRAKLFPGVH
jgi:nucleotide-binding universal stress UspA family protein